MHLCDDIVIVEPVDRNDAPVRAQERSAKIFVTPVFTPTPLPLIRYEITDEITLLDEPCPCGSAHRRLADVQGRLDDGFWYGQTHVHAHLFRSRLGQDRYIVEYQVKQTARGAAIEVCCTGSVDLQSLRCALIADLVRAGVPSPEIELGTVERIERNVNGKLKRFLPLT
jgi:phenylacetate-coenzyme A ligase PaaK-like adenylate-forming protein